MNILNQIKSDLFGMQDAKYKEFHTKLIPTVDKDTIIGVRIPDLRKMAKELSKNEDIDIFLNILPHQYYEENNLNAFIIETEKNYDKCVEKINTFLPFVNNWATCDSMRPKVFSKNTDKLIAEIEKWIKSKKTYTVRFGIECLMTYYLDKEFNEKYIQSVCDIQSEEYYINMMRAWYFATALAKQYDSTVKYIENKKLDTWTHNKTIQKAIESHRITKEQKTYLKTLKRKDN